MAARNLPVYTTGTISGTSGTATVSGSGTLWTTTDSSGNQVNNVVAGDWLVLPGGQGAIPIKSVNSATSITLEYNLPATISAGTSYRIIKYAPVVAGTLAALLTRIEAMGSSSSPDTSRYIDDGAARMVLRIVSGVPTISVGAASAADGSLINAIQFDKTNGNVGFGISAPTAKIDVRTTAQVPAKFVADNYYYVQAISTATASGQIGYAAIAKDSGGTDRAAYFFNSGGTGHVFVESAYPLVFSTNATARMQIASGGNVSIGTTSQVARLHVKGLDVVNAPVLGSIAANTPLYISSIDETYGLTVGVNTSTGNVWMQAQNISSAVGYSILLNPVGGTVGVGTTSAPSRLTVDNGDIEIRTGNYLFLRPTANDWDMRFKAVSGQKLNVYSGGDLTNPIMTWAHGLRVGINNQSPGTDLHMKETGSYGPQIMLENQRSEVPAGYLIFKKGRSSGAVSVSDAIGTVQFVALDSGSVSRQAAYIGATVNTVGSGYVGGNLTFVADGGTNFFYGNTVPSADNTFSLGASGNRWSVVYAATGTINTSDKRQKTDITPLPSVLPFIEKLNPVMFRYKIGGVEIDRQIVEEEVEEQATRKVSVEKREVEIIDGKAVEKVFTVEEDEQLFDEFPVVDEQGNLIIEVIPAVEEVKTINRVHKGMRKVKKPSMRMGEDGVVEPVEIEVEDPIFEEVEVISQEAQPERRIPKMHRVPRMVKVMRKKAVTREVERPGKRIHLGLLAQEVAAIAKETGLDAAVYTYDPETDHHGLRYDQFIAPLIKGEQELIAENKSLRALVNDLSARVAALEAAQ